MQKGKAVAAVLLAALGTGASAQVVNPRVTTDSSVDCSSAEAVVRQITKPDMTDEQKAIACWRFMLGHYYHWYPPREANVVADVRDFAKAINSYGYGPCFLNAPVLTALWEAAGMETRSYTITGHSIPEVKYGGAWHMLDADARGWHRKADGQIASVDELGADASLFTSPGEKSDPYYPFAAPDVSASPLVPWGPPSKMMDLYLSRKDNYRYNRRAVSGHPMYLRLRPGEVVTLNRENEGKWFRFAGIPEKDGKSGPVSISGDISYANGRLKWTPDLSRVDAADLLWVGSRNVKLAGGRLVRDEAGEPGIAVFRIWSPYVLVESSVSVTVSGPGLPAFEVSDDGGYRWSLMTNITWTAEGNDAKSASMDLSSWAGGQYELALRATLDSGSLSSLSFDNLFQLAQLSLPRLKAGQNKVTVSRGPDEGVVQLVLGNGSEVKDRYLAGTEGLVDPLKQLQPATYGQPAFVTFKLAAPAPLTALSVGANLTMDAGKDQHIAALYSLDGGRNWAELWRLADHSNNQNSQFEMDRRVPLTNEAGAKEVMVKFDMIRNSKYFCVGGVRLYAFYSLPQPPGAKLNVTLGWEEKNGGRWTGKSRSVVAEGFPYGFRLKCGGEDVRLASIRMDAPAR